MDDKTRTWKRNNTFFGSVKYAWFGILSAFEKEPNFLRYFLIIFVAFVINIVLRIDLIEWVIWLVTILGVFSSELLNTAIENICDMITREYSDKIKYIKDIAAGSVLIWGFGFFSWEGFLIIKSLLEII